MKTVLGFVLFALVGPGSHAAGPTDWPQFRGPGGSGIADQSALPTVWSATEHVAWKADIPGRGWSSPIVWRDRVYVTTAVSAGAFKAPSTGIYGNDYAAELTEAGLAAGRSPQARHRARHRARRRGRPTSATCVFALDARTGKDRLGA